MKRTEIMNHKGIQIFYSDFSNLNDLSEIEALIKEVNSYIQSRPPKSLLTLTNFENTFFNSAITKKISEMAAGNKPHVKANAVIGITGLKKIVFDGIIKGEFYKLKF